MQLNEYRHTHMQHKLPIDQKKTIISLLMIPHNMLKPQADYCIREVIG